LGLIFRVEVPSVFLASPASAQPKPFLFITFFVSPSTANMAGMPTNFFLSAKVGTSFSPYNRCIGKKLSDLLIHFQEGWMFQNGGNIHPPGFFKKKREGSPAKAG